MIQLLYHILILLECCLSRQYSSLFECSHGSPFILSRPQSRPCGLSRCTYQRCDFIELFGLASCDSPLVVTWCCVVSERE